MKNILITGATGFIGERLLAALDDNVRIVSRNKHPFYDTVVCNLGKDPIPEESFCNIKTVFHLAGIAHDFRDADKIKHLYYSLNVEATIEIAELAVKNKVDNFVFVSSVKAGGTPSKGKCLSEDEQDEPDSIYGKSKRDAELKILEIGKKSSMNVTIIRPSLVYGPNFKGNLLKMFLGIQKGWFPPLPDTGNMRSMVHVDDLVRALLFVAKDNRANGEIYIVTDGERYTSSQIYEILCSVLGKSPPTWRVPKLIFKIFALNSQLHFKFEKLFADECYSSKKINSLGFKPYYKLNEMNEKSF